MAVKQMFGNPKYIGLSTDTKPSNTTPGARFYETDTQRYYINDGSDWRLSYYDIPPDETSGEGRAI